MIKPLITNKDIKAINEKFNHKGSITPDETTLLREASMSESQIQIACHNLIKVMFPDKALFVQIDNGGKMGIGQKMKKKAEGTQAGFPDCIILVWNDISSLCSAWDSSFVSDEQANKSRYKKKTIFVEFKKIGGKATEKQLYWHNFLKDKGESAHFCNNTVYFERQICKEIDKFLLINN